jgi:hypothetical protein
MPFNGAPPFPYSIVPSSSAFMQAAGSPLVCHRRLRDDIILFIIVARCFAYQTLFRLPTYLWPADILY